MSEPRNTEPQANYELARALRRRNPDWTDHTVHAERTNVIQLGLPGSGAAKRPDILVSPPRRQAVIVETEFAPARTVEQDAIAQYRRGDRCRSTSGGDCTVPLREHGIEGTRMSVARGRGVGRGRAERSGTCRSTLGSQTGDLGTIAGSGDACGTRFSMSTTADFQHARDLVQELDATGAYRALAAARGVAGGGHVDELADAIEYLSLSERQLARGTGGFGSCDPSPDASPGSGWRLSYPPAANAAELLAEHAGQGPLARIASGLHQEAGKQTERMAGRQRPSRRRNSSGTSSPRTSRPMHVLGRAASAAPTKAAISAFMFRFARRPGRDPTESACGVHRQGDAPRHVERDSPRSMVQVRYCARSAGSHFSIARDLVQELPVRAVPPVTISPGGCSRPSSQIGSSRFYTLPASACLLASSQKRLNVEWSDRAAIERLRIADFACGTGALLSAAQRAVYRRYRRAGGNDRDLHRALMERCLVGLDIMPAATHLTCSMLSRSEVPIAS